MKNGRRVFAVTCLAFSLFTCASGRFQETGEEPEPPGSRIRVYSFNIRIFGAAKMARPGVAAILADIISKADIAAIQEVRSAGAAPVEKFMALLPENYACVLGPREGRSRSKEQFWIIYNTEKLAVLAEETWPDSGDKFERSPLAIYFQTADKFDFILMDNHIRPSNAAAEIEALPEAAAYYRGLWQEPDLLVLGDFNADGLYYDETLLAEVFPEDSWKIIITNDLDTTVAAADNTYDRIIISYSAIEDYTGNHGVIRFDDLYGLDDYGITPGDLSDHYPVWAEFFIHRDRD
ncbi:MAG: endonuclease [Treponema sp.]|jgi:endonuclease/exonuclease/phosphatase family metal-dependent hydrolase|nr:endonuclease [Treponema sp.]